MNINQAAFNGNTKKVREILETNPHQVNQIFELKDGINIYRVTPIFFAAISGNLGTFKMLLERNPLLHSEKDSLELLKWSVYGKNQTTKCFILNELSKHKDIDISQMENQTLEQFKTSFIALNKLLSKNNFKYGIETIDDSYYFLAGFKGDITHLREIMKSEYDLPTLYLIATGATSNGKVEVLQFLQNEYNLNFEIQVANGHEKSFTLAFIAARFGHVKVLQYLHSLGIDLTVPLAEGLGKGLTPAAIAAQYGHVEVLRYLHSLDIDLTAPLADGKSPFTLAIQYGHVEILKFFESIGIKLEAPLSAGCFKDLTPAIIATVYGQDKVLQLFKSFGISIISPIMNGQAKGHTPATIAAQYGQINVLKFIQSEGVSLAAPIKDGQAKGLTPAAMAAQYGHLNVLRFIQREGVNLAAPIEDGYGKGHTPATLAAQHGYINVLEFIYSLRINLESPILDGEFKGHTPATLAARFNRVNVLKFFCKDTEWIDDEFLSQWKDLSVFHFALLTRQPQHVKALIDLGMTAPLNVNDLNNKQWSLIDFIGEAYQEKYVAKLENVIQICKILQENGICKRDELLQVLEEHHFNLFEALLTSPEKRLLKVLSEKRFLKKILASRRIPSQDKALLRRLNNGENLQIRSLDLTHFIKDEIDVILSKDAPVYSAIKQKFAKLSSKKSCKGYQFKWESHKTERVLRILEDLEKASTEISQLVAKSEKFQSVAPATYTLIDPIDVSEEGKEVEISLQCSNYLT